MNLFKKLLGTGNRSKGVDAAAARLNTENGASGQVFEILDGRLVKYNGTSETVVIPASVRVVDELAFYSSRDIITKVIFPPEIEGIKMHAFLDCFNLREIVMPKRAEYIEEAAFFCCRSLESIAIPEGVSTIGGRTFDGCVSLKYLILPDSIVSLYTNLPSNNIVVKAHKGGFAERIAAEHNLRFEPTEGSLKKGFYPPRASKGPILFCDPERNICKEVVNSYGVISDTPLYDRELLYFLEKHCSGFFKRMLGKTEFLEKENGYLMVTTIQTNYENGNKNIDICADMDDSGNIISAFRFYTFSDIS